MHVAVISGDIVSSTALTPSERENLAETLLDLLDRLKEKFEVFGRLIKGDYLECVVPNSKDGLRVALILKSFVKQFAGSVTGEKTETQRIRYFKSHGIRLALGYGTLSVFDPEKNSIDGEAIYLSGREISGETTYNKQRLTIKNSLFFASNDSDLNESFQPIFALLDVLLTKATARQCEVLFLKLMHASEEEIAKKLNIGQSAVNQHSTGVGWNAIESAVNYFEKRIAN